MHKFKYIFTALVIIVLLSTSFISLKAASQEDLDRINAEIERIRQEKQKINGDLNSVKSIDNEYARELRTLNSEIALLNNQIEETNAVIMGLEAEISLAEQEIEVAKSKIDYSDVNIAQYSELINESLVKMYTGYKTQENINMLFSSTSSNLIKLEMYTELEQDGMSEQMLRLQVLKAEADILKASLEQNKVILEENRVKIVSDREKLEVDKADVVSKTAIFYKRRAEVMSQIKSQEDLLAILSDQEKQALAEQSRIERIIFDSTNTVPPGNFVTRGQVIGAQGCTGMCTGPHLHFMASNNGVIDNPCNFMLGGGPCGGGGTHSWPVSGTYYLTSGYGYRCIGNRCAMHSGIDLASPIDGAAILAAHDGYYSRTFVPCNSADALCKNGGANVVTVCENTNCNIGMKTQYWHLK